MKSKQILSIKQMQHLQELGLELKDTMLYWIKPLDAVIGIVVGLENDWQLDFIDDKKKKYLKYIPAYTLQDVLDALPVQIEIPLHPERGKYELRIKMMVFDEGRVMYSVVYEKEDYIDWIVLYSDGVLIDAAYEMLCWAIENKFVETNKNE